MDKLRRQQQQQLRALAAAMHARTAVPPGPAEPATTSTTDQTKEGRGRRWLEWVSLPLSVAALTAAGLTYLDQRENNALTQSRYERRYADRVAWWQRSDFPSGRRVNTGYIQNRSPVPLRAVALIAQSASIRGDHVPSDIRPSPVAHDRILVSVGDVPPCAITEVVLSDERSETPQFLYQNSVGEPLIAFDMTIEFLLFTDGDGQSWNRGPDGQLAYGEEPLRQPASFAAILTLKGVPIEAQPAEDCTDS
jgi:hypothetical protein